MSGAGSSEGVGLGLDHGAGLGSLENPTTDLEALSRLIMGGHLGLSGTKEASGGVDSLRYVYTGRKNAGVREKERKERGKEMVEEQKERQREREKDPGRDAKLKSDGEDGGLGVPGLLWKGTGKLIGSRLVLIS